MSRRADYKSIAPDFDRRYQIHNYKGLERALRTFLLSHVPLDVLDVGCGTGHWLVRLTSPETRIIGLDASAEMLLRAGRNQTFELVQAEAEALPFDLERFDRIFCVNSFHHFTDKRTFLGEMRRTLRASGGFLLVSLDPHTGLDKWWVYDYFESALELDMRRYLSTSQIRQMLSEVGFTHCRTDVVEVFAGTVSARSALERGDVARTATSQLTILTDDEYDKGWKRIQEDMLAAAANAEELVFTSELRLYATTGWLR